MISRIILQAILINVFDYSLPKGYKIQIYLFGSSLNNFIEANDIDLMIVYNKLLPYSIISKYEFRLNELSKKLLGKHVDCLYFSLKEVKQEKLIPFKAEKVFFN